MTDSIHTSDEFNGFGILIPFVKELGFVLNSYEGGHSEIVYAPRTEHMNSFEVAHGGALMTLLDVSMATAARSVDKSFGVLTIEMKTSFLRPATGALKALGELMHRTRSTAFVQSSVYNEQGDLCAHATGTFRYVQRRPPVLTQSLDEGAGAPKQTTNAIATD